MRVQSKGNSGNETGDHLTMSSGERRAGHLVTWSLGLSVTPDWLMGDSLPAGSAWDWQTSRGEQAERYQIVIQPVESYFCSNIGNSIPSCTLITFQQTLFFWNENSNFFILVYLRTFLFLLTEIHEVSVVSIGVRGREARPSLPLSLPEVLSSPVVTMVQMVVLVSNGLRWTITIWFTHRCPSQISVTKCLYLRGELGWAS